MSGGGVTTLSGVTTSGSSAGGQTADGNASGTTGMGSPTSGGLSGGLGGSGGAIGGTAGAIGGTGDSPSSGGLGGTAGDSFQISAHLASEDDERAPTTVGLVQWSTTLGTPTAATIEFGPTTEYGMEAPVDVTQTELRGVLLGMKPEQTYHFRVSATLDGQTVRSNDTTIRTGAPPATNLLTSYEILVPDKREAGYIVTSVWNQGVGGMAFILDAEGDIVWWYDPDLEDGVARAAISADGRDLWMISSSITGGEPLVRVGLDGLGRQAYSNTSGTHDIIPIEADLMAFIDYGSAAGIGVSAIDRSGQLSEILDQEDLPPTGPDAPIDIHHLNALAYDSEIDTCFLSALYSDVYSFPRAGATSDNIVALSSILGSTSVWGERQHGLQALGDNHLLMFANQAIQDPAESSVIEFDLSDGSEVWRYNGGEVTQNFGGAQRLPGGNTLVVYSNAGVIHETTPDLEKVLEVTSAFKLGYATWVPSLYPTDRSQ